MNELDPAYARCLQSLPLQYMYFDFKANVFKLKITCKDEGGVEGCVWEDKPTVELASQKIAI